MKQKIYELEKRSRKLAYILRHDDKSLSNMETGGWLPVSFLVEISGFTIDMIEMIINSDAKGRFEYNVTRDKVRALYGHSVNIDLGLKSDFPPKILYHGTATKNCENILSEGIKTKSRRYVHLCESLDTAIEVGNRHGNPTVFQIDAATMYADGHKFYKSNDGIWLTSDIPSKYFMQLNNGYLNSCVDVDNMLAIYVDSEEMMYNLVKRGKLEDSSISFERISDKAFEFIESSRRLSIVALCDDNCEADNYSRVLDQLRIVTEDVIVVSTFDCGNGQIPWIKVQDISASINVIESIVDLLYGSYPLPVDYYNVHSLISPRKRIFHYFDEAKALDEDTIRRILCQTCCDDNRFPRIMIMQFLYQNQNVISKELIQYIGSNFYPHVENYIIGMSKQPKLKSPIKINLFYIYA